MMRLCWIVCFVVVAGCSDDDGNPADSAVAGDAAAGDAVAGDAAAGDASAPDAKPTVGEPCDYKNPQIIKLGVTVTGEAPSAACTSGTHFYRFTPTVAGVYTIVKSGGSTLGFCATEASGGCMCAVNSNCCTACTLLFDLVGGGDLPAGSNNQVWIIPDKTPGTYSFTVTGPN